MILAATLSAYAGCPPVASTFVADPRLSGPDVVLVWKSARLLGHYEDGRLSVRDGVPGCWPIALAPNPPSGTKRREGDRATPEGWYRTSDKPSSAFPLAISVHYPNLTDALAGEAAGIIDAATRARIAAALAAGQRPPQQTAMGGEILLHGGGASADWTLGCVALETADLAALRARLPADMAFDLLVLP